MSTDDTDDYERGEMREMANDEHERKLNEVYDERNRCIAAICAMAQRLSWSTWRGKHEPANDPSWDAEWRNVIYINLPTGQVSWHIHDRDLPLFSQLPLILERPWDGHTTEQKYKRLQKLSYGTRFCVRCGLELDEHLLCGGC